MKKQFIILSLLAASFTVRAQINPPPVKKVYTPSQTAYQDRLTLNINVTSGQALIYLQVLNMGGLQGLANSKELHGNEIQAFAKDYQTVVDSVTSASARAYNAWFKAGEKKWASDTLKVVKH